ncbi:LuxR C-terminal-related transcriptional regulator [Actinosynnema sp. NPDC004786]
MSVDLPVRRLPPTVAAVAATPLVREGLGSVIRQAGLRWLGAAATPRQALAGLRRVCPDVVLVDSAVDPRGVLIGELARPGRVRTVLGLVSDDRPATDFRRVGRTAGARALVPLDADPAELVNLILRVHRGGHVPVRAVSAAEDEPATADVDHGEPLSPRQTEVLELIAAGLASADIAESLELSVETVRTHVKAILRRLGARDRAHAVSIAFRSGLLARHPVP